MERKNLGFGTRVKKLIHRYDNGQSAFDKTDQSASASAVLRAESKRFSDIGTGGLSLKTFFNGPAWYRVGSSRYRVEGNRYLLLNEGQSYEIIKDSDHPVESFVVFFQDLLVKDVYQSLSKSTQQLLDDPTVSAQKIPVFYERTYPLRNIAGRVVLELRTHLNSDELSDFTLEMNLRQLLEALFVVHLGATSEVDSLSALRLKTRIEMYRRLHIAREYILASIGERFSLQRIADAACMSQNHLLRNFRQLYNQTPHQMYDQLRLEQAKLFLSRGGYSVSEICKLLGWESLGTFSTWFRRMTGCPPLKYASQKGDIEENSSNTNS